MEQLLTILPEEPQSPWVRYGGAAAILAFCVAIQFGVGTQAQSALLFFLLPGIFLTGFLFGLGAALFSAFITAGYAYLVLSSHTSFPTWLLPFSLFAITELVVALVAVALRTEMERVVRAEKSKTLFLMELAHRTKNNLAMLSAMMRLQSRQSDVDASEVLKDMSERIQVMAHVYDHLTIRADQKVVDASQYLRDICRNLAASISGQSPVAIHADIDQLYIHSEQAVPIAMIMNELITNSLKYAFPNGQSGLIKVELRVSDDVVLSVTDNGKGGAKGGAEGIGSRVISLLAQQLGGTIGVEDQNPGSRAVLRLPKQAL